MDRRGTWDVSGDREGARLRTEAQQAAATVALLPNAVLHFRPPAREPAFALPAQPTSAWKAMRALGQPGVAIWRERDAELP